VDNVWESEDGPTKKNVCARDYYWDHGFVWLSDNTLAVAGIGDDDELMIDGVRIIDIEEGKAGHWRSDRSWAKEIMTFPGPAGKFFAADNCLYSSDDTGLSRWDFKAGVRTGYLKDFSPTHHHRSAGELVQVKDGQLIRWSTTET